jgi:FkbM family methyltransferase
MRTDMAQARGTGWLRNPFYALATCLPAGALRKVAQWQFESPLVRRALRQAVRLLRNRDVTIRYGVGAGLRFNAAGSNPGYALGTTEPRVQDALGGFLRPGGVMYDIGANVGFYAVLGAHVVGREGQVYAFEPLPESAAALRRNASLNGFHNLRVFEMAASSANGEGQLLLAPESTWARLSSVGARPDTNGSLPVQLVAIDQLIAKESLRLPDLLKIDVEGAEIDVLEGLRVTLAECRPAVICEMHGKNADFGALMRSLDYEVKSIEEGDRPIEDCYWNTHAVATPRNGRHGGKG